MTPALLVCFALATSSGAAPAQSATARNAAELQSTMRLGFVAVARIQPYLASPPLFRDPAHYAELKANLDVLARVQHQVSQGKRGVATETIARLFDQQVGRARFDLNSGRVEASRMRLVGITSWCTGCHQRQPAQADFDDAAKVVDSLGLGPLERAEFYAATRQFDRALEAWQGALWRVPKNDVEAMDQARGLRRAIGVAVRAKDDPAMTLALLTAAVGRKDLPGFVRLSMAGWIKDAKAWRAEKLVAAQLLPQDALDRARTLLTESRALETVVIDDTRLIWNLRAATYLDRAIAGAPNAPWRPEALYLLGVATEADTNPILWELDGAYLEACVRDAPHTALAEKCVQRLGERLNLAFTSDQRLEMPQEVGQHLGELRVLAQVAAHEPAI